MNDKRVDLPERMGDEVETPPSLFAAIERRWRIVWDAAATPQNTLTGNVMDCLGTDWGTFTRNGGCVYLNPPYSNPAPFLAKALEMSDRGVSTVALLKADHSTRWWREFVDGQIIIPLALRIRFYYDGRPLRYVAAFPSVLVFYDGGLRTDSWR